ncbi:MAG: glycoside hydrolase family 3 N-terminal domain-containing protein [Candidatus Rokuibacteriota bacterium]
MARRLAGGALAAFAALVLAACASAPSADVLARLEPRLGQLLLAGFRGTTFADNAELDALLCRARTGGILLFGRNIVDAAQVAALTAASAARAAECGTAPLLVAVDAEGGRVMRLSPGAGYVATLSHKDLGDGNDLALTELEARRIGAMLREAGINWNLAPVVDVGYNPANPVIVGYGRSFSANPVLVAAQARAFITGLRREGVLSALKHFPGHGSSFADSHHGFVDVTDTADARLELAPYRRLFAEGAVDSVMTAHVFNRYLDDQYPATLSRRTITGLLRGDLGWSGAVVSDDLRMGAIEQHYGLEDAVVLALDAGVDVLLIAEDHLPDGRSAAAVALEAIRSALREGRLSVAAVEAALHRVETLKRALRTRESASP